ncbi:MAG: acetyl-CoA carboxylase biotin carboxyl carrier protein [Leptolyngbyaceae cyanobacterium CSU_1_3]|nr:acetyl-CoA carboxylase biotin carboxyl carrier protein [Leptolyngbyaceae cyanobacterium CSU_1_3]
MPLDLSELRELLTALNQTDIAELTLKSEDFELTVRRGLQAANGHNLARISMGETTAPMPTPPIALTPPDVPANGGAISIPPTPPPNADRRFVEVLSPMVGTFYRSPAPDEAPFVEIGDRIRSGQTVCIIEAMKLMNEIEAEVSGEIVEILVEDASPVEYGQPLMRVNPG